MPATNWAGKGTFLDLLKSLPLAPLRIDRESNALLDPRRLASGATEALPQGAAEPAELPGRSQQPAPAPAAIATGAVERLVMAEVAESDRPIALACLAQIAREKIPGLESNWLGHGSWKRLLESIRFTGVRIVWHQQSGYALDPAKHRLDLPDGNSDAGATQLTEPQAAPVAPLLEAAVLPLLSTDKYRALLESLSESLLTTRPFALAPVTKAMRDHCLGRQMPISREQCNSLVRTLLFNGFLPDEDPSSFEDLVARTCAIVVAAAMREGLRVEDEDRGALMGWLGAEVG